MSTIELRWLHTFLSLMEKRGIEQARQKLLRLPNSFIRRHEAMLRKARNYVH